MKRIVKIGLAGLALMLVSLDACSLSSGPIDGQVLDETTGKPVADAIVVVTWTGDWTKIFGESSSSCYHAETARTDANGKYHIAGWSRPWSLSDLRVSARPPLFEAYKAGYTRPNTSSNKPETVLVVPFKGTKDEYFDQLVRAMTPCSGAGDSGKNLYRLHSAIAEEARKTAQTPRQKAHAEYMTESASYLLVDETKPTGRDSRGQWINLNPDDGYKKEDLLK